MPYQKVITYYTKQERKNLHRMGYWVDRDGNNLFVYQMSKERFAKLVKTLGSWAIKEHDPIQYLCSMPIFPHIISMLNITKLDGDYASMFWNAYRYQNLPKTKNWNVWESEPSVEELAQMNASAEELRLQFEGE
jgi:hypothetical protein